jgi:hypothetical protein
LQGPFAFKPGVAGAPVVAPVPIPVVVLGAKPGDTPALTPEEPPAVAAAPCAAVPLVRAPAASAQPEDMASAVANIIVVIFITSVFLFDGER